MNSQNTPVHIKLWHREFWQLAVANLLLSMSVYMLIPVLPLWLIQTENFTMSEVGWSMGVFAVGLYMTGRRICGFVPDTVATLRHGHFLRIGTDGVGQHAGNRYL